MDNGLKEYQCALCGKELKNLQALRMHNVKMHMLTKATSAPVPPRTEAGVTVKVNPLQIDTNKWKELPAPIKEHLEKTFGNWVNHMEIGQEWKQDFGGYGMYIKVPQSFSTEWKVSEVATYDNASLSLKGTEKKWEPDVRWKPLKDLAETTKWITLVKKHILDNAYQKGLKLPSTNTGYEEERISRDQYEAKVSGQPA